MQGAPMTRRSRKMGRPELGDLKRRIDVLNHLFVDEMNMHETEFELALDQATEEGVSPTRRLVNEAIDSLVEIRAALCSKNCDQEELRCLVLDARSKLGILACLRTPWPR